MKPVKNDVPIKVKISGRQLTELQKHALQMCEAFGLDRKIENYKGTRPISLYSWDLDCILDVLSMALDDEKDIQTKKVKDLLNCMNCTLN
jgi:transcription elongation factor Elf1